MNGVPIAKKFCFICNSFKKDEKTKHCFYCDRCIDNFDHHCYWVNNCISKKNLNIFFSFLLLIIINVAFNSYLSFNCLISDFHQKEKLVNLSEFNIESLNNYSLNSNNKNHLKNLNKNFNSTVFVHVKNFTFSNVYKEGNFNLF